MKTLEQEAEEYFDNNIYCDGITNFEEDISKRCFIAGANSKSVQAEKIMALIEENESILQMLFLHGNESSRIRVAGRIELLKEQLKNI